MPVQVLSAQQVAQYGRFAGEPSPSQLARYFHLDDRDARNILSSYTEHTRLGFAVQLGVVRFLGVFPTDLKEIPPGVVTYIANQLNITDRELDQYGERTQRRHK